MSVCALLGASYGQQRRQIRDEEKQGRATALDCGGFMHQVEAGYGEQGTQMPGVDVPLQTPASSVARL